MSSKFRRESNRRVRENVQQALADTSSYTKGRLPRVRQNMIEAVGIEMVFNQLRECGWVDIQDEPDDVFYDDLFGDCYDPVVNNDMNPNVLAKQEAAAIEQIKNDGVWVMVAKHRDPTEYVEYEDDREWHETDSCGGFVGGDFWGSGYDIDFMIGLIDAIGGCYHVPKWRDIHHDPRYRPSTWWSAMYFAGLPTPEGFDIKHYEWTTLAVGPVYEVT